jgi:hypothetical protein
VRFRLALGYFLVQALAVAAWWALLASQPAAWPLFAVRGSPRVALGAFAPGDLGLVALGSAVVALRGGRAWTRELAWCVAGAVAYAAAYTATTAAARASSPLGALLMLPAAGASVAAALTLSRGARGAALPTGPAA